VLGMGYLYGVMVTGLNFTKALAGLPVVPVKQGNHHITLLYIGDRKPSGGVGDKLRRVVEGFQCFRVELGQPLLLPSLVKPRVLAIEINDHGLLARLRALIINALRDSGVNIADRYLGDFKPHLTVAYVRVKVDPQYLITLLSYVDLSTLPVRAIPVDRVSLVRAWGDNYTELVTYRLSCS